MPKHLWIVLGKASVLYLDFDLLLRSGFFSPQMQAVVGLCMFGCRYVLKVLARPRHPSQKQKVKENKGSHDDSESCDPRWDRPDRRPAVSWLWTCDLYWWPPSANSEIEKILRSRSQGCQILGLHIWCSRRSDMHIAGLDRAVFLI